MHNPTPAAADVRRRRRQPCEVPSLPHSLNSRFYACGWRCDRHSPWGRAGHDSPTPRVNTDTESRPV